MNERIKALALQAGAVNVWEWASDDVLDTKNMDAEKFAELIVKECMKVCKKTEQYEVGNQDPDEVGCIRAGAVFCREDIKQHFGVEE
jgi:hypothetical protein